jgi:hypothetical protein
MFTVLIKYHDGHERLLATDGDIQFEDGVLVIDGEDISLESGDAAFVMNRDGNTVRRFRG